MDIQAWSLVQEAEREKIRSVFSFSRVAPITTGSLARCPLPLGDHPSPSPSIFSTLMLLAPAPPSRKTSSCSASVTSSTMQGGASDPGPPPPPHLPSTLRWCTLTYFPALLKPPPRPSPPLPFPAVTSPSCVITSAPPPSRSTGVEASFSPPGHLSRWRPRPPRCLPSPPGCGLAPPPGQTVRAATRSRWSMGRGSRGIALLLPGGRRQENQGQEEDWFKVRATSKDSVADKRSLEISLRRTRMFWHLSRTSC